MDVLAVEILHDHVVHLRFKDGHERTVDLDPYLRGPIFDLVRTRATSPRSKGRPERRDDRLAQRRRSGARGPLLRSTFGQDGRRGSLSLTLHERLSDFASRSSPLLLLAGRVHTAPCRLVTRRLHVVRRHVGLRNWLHWRVRRARPKTRRPRKC